MTTSRHYQTDRQEREKVIKEVIGYGKVVKVVFFDGKQGEEMHEITSTGIINIYNVKKGRLITKKIARPGQIRRYYKEGKAPRFLIEKAIDNTVKNRYNYLQKERKRKMTLFIILWCFFWGYQCGKAVTFQKMINEEIKENENNRSEKS